MPLVSLTLLNVTQSVHFQPHFFHVEILFSILKNKALVDFFSPKLEWREISLLYSTPRRGVRMRSVSSSFVLSLPPWGTSFWRLWQRSQGMTRTFQNTVKTRYMVDVHEHNLASSRDQVRFSDHLLSVCQYILDFLSRTTGPILSKLNDWKKWLMSKLMVSSYPRGNTVKICKCTLSDSFLLQNH